MPAGKPSYALVHGFPSTMVTRDSNGAREWYGSHIQLGRSRMVSPVSLVSKVCEQITALPPLHVYGCYLAHLLDPLKPFPPLQAHTSHHTLGPRS